MSDRIVPACRYGHGALQREERFWAMQQMLRLEPPSDAGQNFLPTAVQFVFSLFRCRECGYMEMFDDEEVA